MFQKITNSIIRRAGLMMACIIALVLGSMIGSVLVAESAEGDAAMINLAGSLRMQAYKVSQAYVLDDSSEKVQQQIAVFDKKIHDPLFNNIHILKPSNALYDLFHEVSTDWLDIREQILQRTDQQSLLDHIDIFVNKVNIMVGLLEKRAESKIRLLRAIQGISMFLIIIIVSMAMYELQRKVVEPLRNLVFAADRARKGDFSLHVNVNSDNEDELDLLGDTFNHMSEDLGVLYNNLESRVSEKTLRLEQTNRALELLYRSVKDLSEDEYSVLKIENTLGELEKHLGLGSVSLCMTSEEVDQAFQINVKDISQPTHCLSTSCEECRSITAMAGKTVYIQEVLKKDHEYGKVFVEHVIGNAPDLEQQQLISAVADNIAIALSLEEKTEQENRLVLMEERTVIARELHDSLAQSLSYLKIQVSRIQMLMNKQADVDVVEPVIGELKEGLNAAYRQLRELLTTFRLRMEEPSLEEALRNTVAEYSDKTTAEISLEVTLHHKVFKPNEEVHVLQVVREALSNAVKHSQADNIMIALGLDAEDTVFVTIEDDGIGISNDPEKQDHYGLIIMRGRAESLNGTLEVTAREQGGTQVKFMYSRKNINNNLKQVG